jgi:hypothetical protein
MRFYVFLLLISAIYETQGRQSGESCTTDDNCLPWLSCINGVCAQCSRQYTHCSSDNTTWPCCEGTKCYEYPGLPSMCTRKCNTDSECPFSQGCLNSEKVCVDCVRSGQKCDPVTAWPCCSGKCENGVCQSVNIRKNCVYDTCSEHGDCCEGHKCVSYYGNKTCMPECSRHRECGSGTGLSCYKKTACSNCSRIGVMCSLGENTECCSNNCVPISNNPKIKFGRCSTFPGEHPEDASHPLFSINEAGHYVLTPSAPKAPSVRYT